MTPPSLPLLTPFSSSVHKYLLRACEALCQAGGEGDSAASRNGPSPAPMKLAFQRREGQGSNNHPVTMISCCTKGQVWGCADGPPPRSLLTRGVQCPAWKLAGAGRLPTTRLLLELSGERALVCIVPITAGVWVLSTFAAVNAHGQLLCQ